MLIFLVVIMILGFIYLLGRINDLQQQIPRNDISKENESDAEKLFDKISTIGETNNDLKDKVHNLKSEVKELGSAVTNSQQQQKESSEIIGDKINQLDITKTEQMLRLVQLQGLNLVVTEYFSFQFFKDWFSGELQSALGCCDASIENIIKRTPSSMVCRRNKYQKGVGHSSRNRNEFGNRYMIDQCEIILSYSDHRASQSIADGSNYPLYVFSIDLNECLSEAELLNLGVVTEEALLPTSIDLRAWFCDGKFQILLWGGKFCIDKDQEGLVLFSTPDLTDFIALKKHTSGGGECTPGSEQNYFRGSCKFGFEENYFKKYCGMVKPFHGFTWSFTSSDFRLEPVFDDAISQVKVGMTEQEIRKLLG